MGYAKQLILVLPFYILTSNKSGHYENEDLYVPGYFEVNIKKGESIVFSAGISQVSTRKLKQLFEKEAEDRTPRDSFLHCLTNSAHQFHNKRDNEHYILAGYPWFKCRARDMFISLPGLTLAIGETDEFEDVMRTASKAILNFIHEGNEKYNIYEMEHPDVLLWAIWALQQYAKYVSPEKCREKYGKLMEEIIEYIRMRKHDNLFLHENGLLYSNGQHKAVTWMNATVNGEPVVPRTGYIVEVNALWYNALRFVAEMLRGQGNQALADTLDAQAEITGKSFLYFIFEGKAYSVFALLFGFTYALQLDKRMSEGMDMKFRMMWRMFLLALFGLFNAAFFAGGDPLIFYALCMIPVIFLRHEAVSKYFEMAFFCVFKKIGQVLTSLSQNLPVSLIFCILGNQV